MLCSFYWAIAAMCFHCPKDFTSFHCLNLHVILHIVMAGYSNALLWSGYSGWGRRTTSSSTSWTTYRGLASKKQNKQKMLPSPHHRHVSVFSLVLAMWQVKALEVRHLLQGYITRKQESLNLNPVVSSHRLSSLPESSCVELLSLEFMQVSIRSPDICVIART